MSAWIALFEEPLESWFDSLHNLAAFDGPNEVVVSDRYRAWQNDRTADWAIPPQTLFQFLDFTFEGNLPGGGRTAYPTLTEAEIPLLARPASQWAPAPHNSRHISITDQLIKLSNNESLMLALPYTTINLKARLWEGMVPMTQDRWSQKQLHKAANWNGAMQFFFQIVWVFFFLNKAQIQLRIKNGFDLVYHEVAHFQNALNAQRRATNPSAPLFNMQGMWLEFVEATFKTMVQRTHSWMVERVNEVLAALKAQYEDDLRTANPNDLYMLGKNFLDYSADLNKILGQADWNVYMTLKDFQGYTNTSADHMASIIDRHTLFYDCMDGMSWPAHESLLHNVADPNLGFVNPRAVMQVYHEAINLRDQMRGIMRPTQMLLQQEHWITVLKSRIRWSVSHGGPRDQTWGFVAYRLTYNNDERWAQFLEKLNEDCKNSAAWVGGGQDIFKSAGLQWLDGQKLGLPQNDSEAAKRHYLQTFSCSGLMLPRMQKAVFITVDDAGLDSYLSQTDATADLQPTGDYGGFVNLIDTIPWQKENTYPEYKGTLRVLGSLLWNHVYPQVQNMCLSPERMFALAVTHPLRIFTGPTVHVQERQRDLICSFRDVLVNETARKMAGR